MTEHDERHGQGGTTRRALLLGAGAAGAAGLLAACGDDGGGTTQGATPTGPDTATPTTGTSSPGASTTGAPTTSGGPSGKEFKAADIPVGGGKIDGAVVVTQPAAGTFKAFSSTCTHMQCTVGTVQDGRIRCSCHGSQFDASSGQVLNGPATRPLGTKTVTVQGTSVFVS